MKNILPLFIILLLIMVSCSDENNVARMNDLALANLNGKVWKIERRLHSAVAKAVCPAAERNESNNSIFTYDEKGFLAESVDLDNDGRIVSTSRYIYRKGGLLEIERTNGSEPKGKIINKYLNGLLIESKVLNPDGSIETESHFEYSGNDITGGKVMDGSGILQNSFKNEYRDGQVNIQTQYDESGNPITISRFRRNEHNDIIEYRISNREADSEYTVIVEYDYDSEGNWIKQTQRFDGEIIAIITRVIEYYTG